jgi:hypothetical protein
MRKLKSVHFLIAGVILPALAAIGRAMDEPAKPGKAQQSAATATAALAKEVFANDGGATGGAEGPKPPPNMDGGPGDPPDLPPDADGPDGPGDHAPGDHGPGPADHGPGGPGGHGHGGPGGHGPGGHGPNGPGGPGGPGAPADHGPGDHGPGGPGDLGPAGKAPPSRWPYIEAEAMRDSDPEMYKLMTQDAKLDRQSQDLAVQYRQAAANQRGKIKEALEKAVSEHFAVRQQRRTLELKRLEDEIKRLQDSLDRRAKLRKDIVEKRVQELLGPTDEMRF